MRCPSCTRRSALDVSDIRTITSARIEKRMIAIAFSGDFGARDAAMPSVPALSVRRVSNCETRLEF